MKISADEKLKHRLRIREILLDKLILAILLLAISVYADRRLARYESALDHELEKLKSAYNFQRLLDQREIEAHERVWRAVSEFKAFVDGNIDQAFSNELSDQLLANGLALYSQLEVESLYLTPRTSQAVTSYFETDIPQLVNDWSGPEGRGKLSASLWKGFSERTAQVGRIISEEIQTKRRPRQPSDDAGN